MARTLFPFPVYSLEIPLGEFQLHHRLRFESATSRIQLLNKAPQAQVARTLFPFLTEFKKTPIGEFKLHPRLRFENSTNRIQLLIKISAGEFKDTPVGEFKLMSLKRAE